MTKIAERMSLSKSSLKTAENTHFGLSFEGSNSWLKRHDSGGTFVIQAGYKENPTAYSAKDNLNPIVITDGQARWYGANACQGDHVRIHGRSKIETIRDSFAACLQQGDDGRELSVVTSYWDLAGFEAVRNALKGQHKVIRNGHQIICVVKEVEVILEGLGSYYLLRNKLAPGFTLLFELGFGTAEEWLINEKGALVNGQTVDSLGVFNLVNAIAQDKSVRGLTSDDSEVINLSLISSALQKESLGRISANTWQGIKTKYGREFLKTLQARVRTIWQNERQLVTNMILTGGGAAFLREIQPSIEKHFLIPQDPQIASVLGAYQYKFVTDTHD